MTNFIAWITPWAAGFLAAVVVIQVIKYRERTRAASKAKGSADTKALEIAVDTSLDQSNATLTGNARYDSLKPIIQETQPAQFTVDEKLALSLKKTIAQIEAYKEPLAGVPSEIFNLWVTEWPRITPTRWTGHLGLFHRLDDSQADPGVLYPVTYHSGCFERQRQFTRSARQLTIWDQVTPPWDYNTAEFTRFPGETNDG